MQQNSEARYLKDTKKTQQLNKQKQQEQDEEQRQFIMLNTRMLDNHWDQNVHGQNGHWKAPGKQPGYKYTYSKDSGLGYNVDNKFEKQIKEERELLQQKQQQTTKNYHDDKSYKFRPYKELENLNLDDVVITIEYCTNCQSHNSTTRHDEQKYLNQALSLQKEILKCFPIITVYLKPNVYDQRDKTIDTQYIRQRCGAFDVQIASGIMENEKLKTVKGVLHSKLKSGKWADHANILSQIRHYMKKTSITIQLTLQDFDLSEIDENQFKIAKVNKLYDIEVSLRPKREKVSYNEKGDYEEGSPRSQLRPTSALSRKSVNTRPKSALSQTSNKSKTFSQYGTRNTNEYDTSKDKIVLKTSPTGQVVFEDIPFDVYHIEIQETNEFKQLKESVDIFEKVKNNEPLELQYDLKHLNLTFLKIICQWGVPATENDIKTLKTFTNGNGDQTQKLLNKGNLERANLEVIPIRDNEEIIDETYDDTFNGSCDVTLLPGKEYVIRIFKQGYSTLDQNVILKPGCQELEFCVEKLQNNQSQQKQQQSQQQSQQYQQKQQNQQDQLQTQKVQRQELKNQQVRPQSGVKTLQIVVYEGSTKENQNIEGAKIQINEQKMKRNNEPYFTNYDGLCEISLQNILEGQLIISHDNYITMIEEYGPQKFDLTRQKEVNFPLMKKPQEGEIQIRVLNTSNVRVLGLQVINPEDLLIQQTSNNIQIENEDGNGHLIIQNIQDNKGVYRIFAEILSVENFNQSVIKVFVIFNDQSHCIEIPKNFEIVNGQPLLWDIGFVYAPQNEFIEINTPTSEPFDKESYLMEYKQLATFLNNSTIDWKQLLGFNSTKKLEVQDDVQQSIQQIFQNLQKFGYDIEENDFRKNNLIHLFSSAKCSSGLISYNKLQSKFKKINNPQLWDIQQEQYPGQYEEQDEQY